MNTELEILSELKRITKHNKILAEQISVAIQGFEAIISAGDVLGLSQKTLDYMKKIEDESLNKNLDS